jgi:hypothetical protein
MLKGKKAELVRAGVDFAKKKFALPTRKDYSNMGFTKDMVRHHFISYENLNSIVSKKLGGIFLDLGADEYRTAPKKSTKTLVVTSAVTGAKVHESFLTNLEVYCKRFSAELIVIPTLGTDKKLLLDGRLKKHVIATATLNINKNCSILGITTSASSPDPVTGLNRVGQRNGTFITGSPKQRLKYVATAKNKMPHALMSTGAVTIPNYLHNPKLGMLVSKGSFVSDHDHVLGAVIVELDKGGLYHFRQITAGPDGSFCDLNVEIKSGKVKPVVPTALVWGDWHSGKTCPIVEKETIAISDKLGIKTWVWHDVFDGDSISHHDQGKQALLAIKALAGRLDLESELNRYVQDIVKASKKRQIIIVKSNHDEHLERYLSEARYIKHPRNHKLGLQLANSYIEGHNPLEYYTKEIAGAKVSNVRWLKRDEDFVIAGIQLGAHGDRGANGSRASISQMENSFGNVVFGHSHTPEILRGAYCVGTSTARKPDYGDGPSSWMNTHCIIYPNGQRQLINLIEGKYTTRKL